MGVDVTTKMATFRLALVLTVATIAKLADGESFRFSPVFRPSIQQYTQSSAPASQAYYGEVSHSYNPTLGEPDWQPLLLEDGHYSYPVDDPSPQTLQDYQFYSPEAPIVVAEIQPEYESGFVPLEDLPSPQTFNQEMANGYPNKIQYGTSNAIGSQQGVKLGPVSAGSQPSTSVPVLTQSVHQAQSSPQAQAPAQGQTPTQGQTPAQGQTPVQGQTPAQGQTPTQGQTPAQGQTPVQGQTPAQGQTPTPTLNPEQAAQLAALKSAGINLSDIPHAQIAALQSTGLDLNKVQPAQLEALKRAGINLAIQPAQLAALQRSGIDLNNVQPAQLAELQKLQSQENSASKIPVPVVSTAGAGSAKPSGGLHQDMMKLMAKVTPKPAKAESVAERILPQNASILVGRKSNDPNVIIPFVSFPLGQLVGKAQKSRLGKWYYAFRGIPYAETPKRFQVAEPVKPWGGLRLALSNGSMCPQSVSPTEVVGEEDCLFLNVFHPHPERCLDETPSGKLPVIFNIHGGAYFMGTGSSFGTKYLLDECIVFVSINYRLGAFGFLTTEDGLIPGNLGLKDQVLALQWTKEYISYFRGDPDSVTIMGISAGGSSVSHLIASPMGKGLFHRAISQSGSALNPWSLSRNPGQFARTLGDGLHCSTNTTTQALKECLETKDFKDIIHIQAQATNRSLLIPFGPVIELQTAVNPFQIKNPAVRYIEGDFNKVPLITGFTQDEGIGLFTGGILADPDLTSIVREGYPIAAPTLFNYNQLHLRNEEMKEFTTKIRQFYFGQEAIGQETRQNLTNLYSDRFIVQGVFENAELHSKGAPVFPYVITYKGGHSDAARWGYKIPTVTHTDDAQYFFNENDSNNVTDIRPGTEQYEFSRNLISLWTSFAKTGTPVGTPPTLNSWTPISGRANSRWFQLDLQPKTLTNYLEDRRRFWQTLGLYNREFF